MTSDGQETPAPQDRPPAGRCKTCRTMWAQEDGRCRACTRTLLGMPAPPRWNTPSARARQVAVYSWWADPQAQADRDRFAARARDEATRLRHSPAGRWSSLDKPPVGMSWGRKWAR